MTTLDGRRWTGFRACVRCSEIDRPNRFVNGTHAIMSAITATVRPGDTLLSVIGAPYDTLRTAIGAESEVFGSLSFYGVKYAEVRCRRTAGRTMRRL
jgi:cystathionine beta-lyase family protein involved in aluminum resistance